MRDTIAGLVLSLFVGCGDTNSGGPIDVDDLDGARRSAICRVAARCGLVDDVSTCMGFRFSQFVDPGLLEAVHAGTVLYDAAKARTCIDGLAAGSCSRGVAFSSRFEPPECDEMFSGTVAAGGACALPEACISTSCNIAGPCPADTCCAGTCLGGTAPPPRPRIGEACTAGSTCVDSFCDQTLVCTALLGPSAACTGTDECARGLQCTGAGCTALPAIGQACPDGECDHIGAFCSPVTAKCTAVGLTDDPCGPTTACSGEVYVCDGLTNTCKLGPKRGEACTQGCLDRSFCDPQTQICSPLLADGQACDSSRQCAGDRCDFMTMSCRTPPVCF